MTKKNKVEAFTKKDVDKELKRLDSIADEYNRTKISLIDYCKKSIKRNNILMWQLENNTLKLPPDTVIIDTTHVSPVKKSPIGIKSTGTHAFSNSTANLSSATGALKNNPSLKRKTENNAEEVDQPLSKKHHCR